MKIRAFSKRMCIGLLALVVFSMPSVYAGEKSPNGKTKEATCSKIGKTTPVSNATDVWWGNRGKAFGNYMKFAKAEVPPYQEAAPAKFDTIYFDLDKAVLRPDGIAVAENILDYMKTHPDVRVRIEGHCCDLYTDAYNQKLGMRRAEAVKKYLTEHGIDSSRIETVSYGESRRVTTDPAQRHLNRRAEVIVIVSGAGQH